MLRVFFGLSNKLKVLGEASIMYELHVCCVQFWWGNLNEYVHLKTLSADNIMKHTHKYAYLYVCVKFLRVYEGPEEITGNPKFRE